MWSRYATQNKFILSTINTVVQRKNITDIFFEVAHEKNDQKQIKMKVLARNLLFFFWSVSRETDVKCLCFFWFFGSKNETGCDFMSETG